jgi:hypothetical protein
MSSATPCPGCGEPRGGRYSHRGSAICWSCWCRRTGLGPLPAYAPTTDPEWVTFRKMIINAVWAVDRQRFVYIDQNTVVGACPLCVDGTVRVFFHGISAVADLECSFACVELDIAHAIRGRRAAA